MVQAQPKGRKRPASDVQARYQNIVREVHDLPRDMLTNLLHEIADAMATEASDHNVAASANGHHQRDGGNGSQPAQPDAPIARAVDNDEEQMSGWDLVITQGGPMAEVARMLRRGNLTAKEEQRMKELAYEAVISIPPPVEPPPTDEEVKQMLHEHRMKKYGR